MAPSVTSTSDHLLNTNLALIYIYIIIHPSCHNQNQVQLTIILTVTNLFLLSIADLESPNAPLRTAPLQSLQLPRALESPERVEARSGMTEKNPATSRSKRGTVAFNPHRSRLRTPGGYNTPTRRRLRLEKGSSSHASFS